MPNAVEFVNKVSDINSTTTTLGNGGVFTGKPEPTVGMESITVSLFTDQASATDGLQIQQSVDGQNWDFADKYTVASQSAGNGKTYGAQVYASWARIVYTNGSTPQGSFRMQTIMHPNMLPTSVIRPQDAYSNENDMQSDVTFNMVWNGTTWDRWKANPYQTAQTPLIAGSGNVANASAAATLTGTATTTVYISGFEITGAGATSGAVVNPTVAGLLGGTRTYTYTFATGRCCRSQHPAHRRIQSAASGLGSQHAHRGHVSGVRHPVGPTTPSWLTGTTSK